MTKAPPFGDAYKTTDNLLDWMENNRRLFGNIYQASVYGSDVFVVSHPEYAEHVLRRNWQNYRKGLAIKRVGLLLGKGLMVSEGEMWKSQRRMIQPAFHQRLLAAMTKIITTSNLSLLKKWSYAAKLGERVNVTRDTSRMTLEIVLMTIFGQDYQRLAPHFSLLSEDTTRDLRFAQAFRSLGSLIVEVAARRRKRKVVSPDFLGMLMEARDMYSGQCMPDGQLVNEIMTLIVAGHETTAGTLNWMWYLLSQHPEVEKKLNAEIAAGPEYPGFADLVKYPYARQVIEETLRMKPAGWLMTRRALNNDQIADYFVPARTEIYLSPYIIQRHPDLWKDPNRFDPDRFDAEQSSNRHPLAMLPFSAGPRNCIGENLARLEMQIHLVMIARKLWLRYLSSEPPELDLGVNLRTKDEVIMRPALLAQD